MPVVYGAIDLSKNELRNAKVQNLPTAPTAALTDAGLLWFDSTAKILKWWDGTAWVEASGASAVVAFGPSTAELTFGAAKADGVATTAARSDHAHGNPPHTVTDHTGFVWPPPVAGGDVTNKTYVDGAVDDLTIVTLPASSLSVVKTGTSATGDLTHTITLNSLTIQDVIPGTAPDPNTPLVPAQPGDIYINTGTGASWIFDGTAWIPMVPAAAGVGAVVAGNGIAVDATAPTSPVVSAVVAPTSDPALTVGATGLSLDTSGFTGAADVDTAIDAALTAAAGAGLVEAVAGSGILDVGAGTGIIVNANDVAIDPTVVAGPADITTAISAALTAAAGAGLVETVAGSGVLDVGAGTGIVVAADSISVDPALLAGVARKFAAALGGTGTDVVTHNLATQDVTVSVISTTAPFAAVEVDWEATSLNTVTVRSTPPLPATYRAIVIG